MKITRYSCPAGSESKSWEITFTALPSASAMQAGIFGKLLDALPLQIAARVVNIGPALAVGQDGHATRRQHLHHQRSAGTRQPGNNCDHSNGKRFHGCVAWA